MPEGADIQADYEMKDALLQLFSLLNVQPEGKTIVAEDVLKAVRVIQKKLMVNIVSQQESTPVNKPVDRPVAGGTGGLKGDMGAFANLSAMLNSQVGGEQASQAYAFEVDTFPETDPTSPFSPISAQLKGGIASAARQQRNAGGNVLIVGELGIVTYQLKLSLTKQSINVTIVKGFDEALMEYKKRPYTGILVDIMPPKEREGLMVVKEINKLTQQNGSGADIVVLAAPPQESRFNEKIDIKTLANQMGVSLFLEKSGGWHQQVISFFTGYTAK